MSLLLTTTIRYYRTTVRVASSYRSGIPPFPFVNLLCQPPLSPSSIPGSPVLGGLVVLYSPVVESTAGLRGKEVEDHDQYCTALSTSSAILGSREALASPRTPDIAVSWTALCCTLRSMDVHAALYKCLQLFSLVTSQVGIPL